MKTPHTYKVKEIAHIAGVSVRTLHYYDEIGLLTPSGRSESGYRLYDDEDLWRLQQILIGRSLGLSLDEIRRSLDDPHFDRRRALIEQREALNQRARQTARMINAIDKAIALLDGDTPGDIMNPKDMFDGFDPTEHEEEARDRWGQTEAWKISQTRTKGYGPSDWAAIKAEHTAIYDEAFAALEAGRSADEGGVMDIAERHRLSIDRWFYPCDAQMHRGLADLYEADARFAKNIDKHGAGLTTFLSAAIRANASRQSQGD